MKRSIFLALVLSTIGIGILSLTRCTRNQANSNPNPSGESVLQAQGSNTRDGFYIRPQFKVSNISSLKLDSQFQATYTGSVYAQPLYYENSGQKMIIIATEQNDVIAFDATSGKTIWKINVGTPVAVSQLPCGNIDPLGITGTPIIDPASQSIYLDAMTTPDGGTTKKHLVFSLSLADGSVRPNWPADVNALARFQSTTFNSEVQNQRAALAMIGDQIFIGYGGHYGDCGNYHGWVLGVNTSNPQQVVTWATRGDKGGVWAPGGIVSDGTSLYFTTGNTEGVTTYSDGNGAFKANSQLAVTDYYAPTDWLAMDNADRDLGGTQPVLLNLNGAPYVLAMGKSGKAYLINQNHMGGVSNAASTFTITSGVIISQPATYFVDGKTYVVFKAKGVNCPQGQTGDLAALTFDTSSPPKMSIAWCANQNGQGSPIVTSSDGTHDMIVWSIGAEVGQTLQAFDSKTGASLWQSTALPATVRRFQTPLVANGRIYVAADGTLYSFVLGSNQ